MTFPRVLIVAENASAKFGGEAFLPLHYFRVLRSRGIETHLLTHARVRDELKAIFPDDLDHLHFVEDSPSQIALWKLGHKAPAAIGDFATDAAIALITQVNQRRAARKLVANLGIAVVHQPTPVSPRLPSGIYDVGAPVIIGPMNGDISYPPGFLNTTGLTRSAILATLRRASEALNYAVVGKGKANRLLVSNPRTRAALPASLKGVAVVELVENGVDLSRFRQSTRKATTGAPVRFAFLGRLVDWKAVDLLLEAFNNVELTPAPELHVIGGGAEFDALRAMAAKSAAAVRIHFHGFVPQHEAAELMNTMDALVLPSLRECGGAVVLEAMAKSMPVIATDWGGPADYLDDNCGILVPPSTRSEFKAGLTAAMEKLASDPKLRASLGRAGRKKVEAEYDWERKIDRILELYQEAIAEGPN